MKKRFLRWLYEWSARQLDLPVLPAASFEPHTMVAPMSRAHAPRLPRKRSPYVDHIPQEWTRWN